MFHIEDIINAMIELKLITLFDEPIDVQILLDANEKYKHQIGTSFSICESQLLIYRLAIYIEKILKMKSTMAEKATVELIKLFISKTDVSSEDKFDFIDFDKLFQPVSVYNDGDHLEPRNIFTDLVIVWTINIIFNCFVVFKDYTDLQYGVKQLHSDCMELFNYFTHRILDAMIKSSKRAYDQIRERFFHRE